MVANLSVPALSSEIVISYATVSGTTSHDKVGIVDTPVAPTAGFRCISIAATVVVVVVVAALVVIAAEVVVVVIKVVVVSSADLPQPDMIIELESKITGMIKSFLFILLMFTSTFYNIFVSLPPTCI
jgi:hypothetical protein